MTDEHLVPQLVVRARGGDVEAVGALYDHYAERVFRFVRFRLSSQQDAEDVSQRVFLQMIQALPRYQSRGIPFGAWLFRIARNAVIDHQRTRRAHEPLEAVADTASGERSLEEIAITSSEIDRVTAALAELTDEQREVITLRFFAELSPGEIAAVLGRREGAIRGTQFRGLQALRRQLAQSASSDSAIPQGTSE
jgi:RNA polymerase sigma-70 factor (ECF subfamily)